MQRLQVCSPVRIFLLLLLCPTPLSAQEFDEKFEHWPIDLKINGTVIAVSDLKETQDMHAMFLRAAGGANAKVVGLCWNNSEAKLAKLKEAFKSAASAEFAVVDGAGVSEELQKQLGAASGVMLLAGGELSTEARNTINSLKDVLHQTIKTGGVVYAEGAAANLLSHTTLVSNEAVPGLNLVPDSVIETNFAQPRDDLRLKSTVVAHPRLVGIGLAPDTALVLSGRKLRVLGSGQATVMLTANEREPFRVQTIRQQIDSRQDLREFLIDLTQWRREAIDRTLPVFPPTEPKSPHVENGTLVIVGGGRTPQGLMEQFVELAGGTDKAHLVYVPCSEQDSLPGTHPTVQMWERMGVKHATFIHTKDRNLANTDEEFLKPLRTATGIWFGGGRQWKFSDSYYGTKAHELMKEVVRRGGVVGGSSAGASIQARYLARATPIQNFDIMAPGYERGGLGFISGVAIDQHFTQRGRQKDMTQLVNRYPQLLGIGIDEQTAIIVRDSQAEVIGAGKVHFYDRNQPVYPDRPDYVALPAGGKYDLAERKVMQDAKAESTAEKPEKKTEAAADSPAK